MRKAWLRAVAPLVVLGLMVSTAACQQAPVAKPKNVIVMISDGMGPAAVTLTRIVSGKDSLVLDEYLVGTRRTSSQDKLVTDSAAAATAMSTGQLTKNDYVGVTPGVLPLGTVLEAAKFQKKMATGVVVKSSVTHATPAGFTAHVKDRDDEVRIAAQQVKLRVDVMFGGGRKFFLPTSAGGSRRDNRNLLAEARDSGYQIITTVEELAGTLRMPVMGLFSDGGLHYDIDRVATKEPSLKEMAQRALDLLSTRKEGFFLMIEGSEIDHTCHDNDAGALVHEVLGYDETFAAVIDFARRDGKTLVVSTSDHETGGLSIVGGDVGNTRSGPYRLRAAKVSQDAMVNMIKAGQPLADVLREYAGITDVKDEDMATYEAATPGLASELQKRRKLALGKIIASRSSIRWASGDHTAVDVGVYAFGPGHDLFRGNRPATWTATAVAQLLDLDMAEATREARERINGDVGR